MRNWSLDRQRRCFGWGLAVLAAFSIYWMYFFDGLPIIFGPSASAEEIAAGRNLFEHKWSPNDPLAHGDGLGPVFNARSCASCHFQGGVGGGGGMMHNAVGFEIHPKPGEVNFQRGTIHNFSVNPLHQESLELVKTLYPTILGRRIEQPARPAQPGHCEGGYPAFAIVVPDFDPVHTQPVQSTALFGAGWIDLISDKAIAYNRRKRMAQGAVRELNMDFGERPVGRMRILPDGRVGKIGWKAQFATLPEFVSNACANELGLGTPETEQAKPLAAQNVTSSPDLDRKQFRALVAFVKTLPRPVEVTPEDPHERQKAARGKELFGTVGCAACHVPDIGGVKGVYSDFLLYTLEEPAASGGAAGGYSEPDPRLDLPPRPPEEPSPGEWKTPPLWGVADSAPYMHDGSAPTLDAAIARHQGDARTVTSAYRSLDLADQAAIISFLKTLKAPPDASPLRDPTITDLTQE